MEQSMRDHILADERLDRLQASVPDQVWETVIFSFLVAVLVSLGAALLIHNILR